MKVLVTGATGYIGHQLALALANQNYKVNALVRDLNSSKIPKHENITLVKGDVCDYESVENATNQCGYVFHTAAYTNLKADEFDNFYNTNVLGTENILKASLHNKVKKVIYTSTLAVYGPSYKRVSITENQPRLVSYSNDYELTKAMSEELVGQYHKKGLSCVTLNVTRVFGPGPKTFTGGVNVLISKMIKNDFLFVPSKLDITANYVFIDDVVNAHILAMKPTKTNEKYIIGGENMNYEVLFKTIKDLTKSKIKVVKINYGFLKMCFSTMNIIQKIVGVSVGITAKVIDSLFVNRCSTSQKAVRDLGYKITPMNSGLLRTINFLNQ